MKQHKYESLVKFVHLDGIKEFKETDPTLFSEDGISTSTLEVDNGKNVPVTMFDVKRVCEMFINHELSLFQFQQWGEWIHMMDFFDLNSNNESSREDETLINLITEIDNIDLVESEKVTDKVKEILSQANNYIKENIQ